MPRPAAWANAVLLFVFATGVRWIFGVAMPILLALMKRSPRLGGLALLLLWLSPVGLAAALADVVGRFVGLRAAGPGRSWPGSPTSWWAGFVAWATILVVTVATAFILVILYPPPVDGRALAAVALALARGDAGAAAQAIWLALAAYVYELELRARETAS